MFELLYSLTSTHAEYVHVESIDLVCLKFPPVNNSSWQTFVLEKTSELVWIKLKCWLETGAS